MSTEIYDQVQTWRKWAPPPPPHHNADVAIKQQPTLLGRAPAAAAGGCRVLGNCITDVPFGVFKNGNTGRLVLLLMLSMRSLQSASDSSEQREHVFVIRQFKRQSEGDLVRAQKSSDIKQQFQRGGILR